MLSKPLPTKAGFYWAKWKIADDGSKTFGGKPSREWEIVEVYDWGQGLEVSVLGEPKTQKLENFFWGPGPLLPPE